MYLCITYIIIYIIYIINNLVIYIIYIKLRFTFTLVYLIVRWRNVYFYGDLDMESIWDFFAFSINMV